MKDESGKKECSFFTYVEGDSDSLGGSKIEVMEERKVRGLNFGCSAKET